MVDLSVCFVGLGSIGVRHLKNLSELFSSRFKNYRIQVDALRSSNSVLDDNINRLIRKQYFSVKNLPSYDVIFINNPSQLHYSTLLELKNKGKFFFVEKPVFVEAVSEKQILLFNKADSYYVACPLRHTKVYNSLKQYVADNKVFCASAVCSTYLPDWRPSVDYRKIYSAQKESKGVKLDLIHEFDYLFSLFGFPEKILLAENKFSDLEIKSNDIVSCIGQYSDMMLEIHLDYFGRAPRRYVDVYTQHEVQRFDFINSRVENLSSGDIINLSELRNDYQQKELIYFFDNVVNGKENMNNLIFANNVIKVIS